MTDTSKLAWSEANKIFLASEFSRLKERLGSCQATQQPPHEEMSSDGSSSSGIVPATMNPPAAIDRLSELFKLSPFEREIILLAAGYEMDSALAARCGPGVTFGLVLAALAAPHWGALTPAGPLRRFALIELDKSHSLTSATLRVDERILHYLVGINEPDARLLHILQPGTFPEWISPGHSDLAGSVASALEGAPAHAHAASTSVVHLCGDDSQGQEDVARSAAVRLGLELFTVRAEDLPPVGQELERFALLWHRESLLLPAALLIRCNHGALSVSTLRLAERLPGVVMVGGTDSFQLDRPTLRFQVDKPAPSEQKRLWQRALGDSAASSNGTLDIISEQYRLSARAIHLSGASAARSNDPGELWVMCRSLARPRLEHLAQRISPAAGWEDLVLPNLQMQALHHLASQVRHRMLVYETWGFAAKGRRGLGVSALFTGESGTGKTLAAEVLAHELALDLYRIDLSSVVSKYIGETEKNLRQVFDAAEEGGSLLLFDEADALFGKRSEVKDSHDHYANIEVGYLLQRLEAYQGLAILTTNLRSAIDVSFQRRLRATIQFPFPDADQRQAIWRRAFPPGTPVDGLDPARLAQLKVAGGNIRNIALNAAFLAAKAGTAVGMRHLLEAAGLEAQKIERPITEPETRGWMTQEARQV